MTTATKNPWTGRLGIEIVGKVNGCCVKSALDWNAPLLGQKTACRICNSVMKTVRAGDDLGVESSGRYGDFRKAAAPELAISGLYFSSDRFEGPENILNWLKDRELAEPSHIDALGEDAFFMPVETVVGGTSRMVKVAPGVLAEVGVKKDSGLSQGGQGSMQPLGVSAISPADGGLSNPNPPAVRNGGVPGNPGIIKGVVEANDGHTHEFTLAPYPGPNGWRVKGMVSIADGHTHMVEAGINPDGSLDANTAPDQSPVGGHAHSHRIKWMGSEVAAKATETPAPAATPVIDSFKLQLDAAIERARGKGQYAVTKAQIEALGEMIGEKGANVATLGKWVNSLGMEKAVDTIAKNEAASKIITDPAKFCGWLKGQAA